MAANNAKILTWVLVMVSLLQGLIYGQRVVAIAFHFEGVGLPASETAILQAASAAGMLPLAFILYRIVRVFSVNAVILVATVLGIFSTAVLMVSNDYSAVLVSRLFAGMSAGTVLILSEYCLLSILKGKQRQRAIVAYLSCFVLGVGIGPVVNAVLYGSPLEQFVLSQPFATFSPAVALWIDVTFMYDILVLGFVFVLLRRLPVIPAPKPLDENFLAYSIKKLPLEMSCFFTIGGVEAAIIGLLPVVLLRFGSDPELATSMAAAFFVGGSILLLTYQLFATISVKRKVMMLMVLFGSAIYIALPLVLENLGDNVWPLFVLMPFAGVIVYYLNAASAARVAMTLDQDHLLYGTTSATIVLIFAIVVMPPIAGFALDVAGGAGFFGTLVLMLLGILLVAQLTRKKADVKADAVDG